MKRHVGPILLGLLVLALVLPTSADAQDTKQSHVRAELVADVEALAPGATFRVGARFHVEKDWHIYWINPGEAGLPTDVKFATDSGLNFGPLQYPEPVLFGVGTPISGYGYENQVLLFATATAPGELAGSQVTIKAKTSWLVCKNVCLPGQAEVALTLPIAPEAKPGLHAKAFDATAAVVPVPVNAVPGLTVTHTVDADNVAPDQEFGVLFVLKAPPGKQLAPRANEHHPAFAPLKPVNYEILTVAVADPKPNPREQLAALVTALAYPELDKAEKIGGTFQFDLIDGGKRQPMAVDFEAELPFAPTGTPIQKIPLPDITAVAAPITPAASPPASASRVLFMILFAFVGGIILNVMPCVLPVLSIKVLSIIGQKDMSRREIRDHGFAYTGGILGSFLALAILVGILKSGGEAVGWGFQFQSPAFVGVLTAVVFLFALSLLDVFMLNAPTSNAIHDAAAKKGLRGSFFNGVFATVLATPCTAPFLGTAVGFAFTQPLWVTFTIFLAVGMGLAFPFLLLAFFPAWTRFMPKPGDWMETFKAVMAFLLLATVVWLLDVLGKQVGAAGLTRMLVLLGLLGFAAWLYGRFGNITRELRTRVLASVVAAAIALGGGVTLLHFAPVEAGAAVAVSEGGIAWQRWSEPTVDKLVAEGKTVFVDFTAAWCWTCKVNEKAVIETDEVKDKITSRGIVPLKGDYTNRDPEITAFLKRHGKAGVPVYAIIGPRTQGRPVILPEVLTKEILLNALDKATTGS